MGQNTCALLHFLSRFILRTSRNIMHDRRFRDLLPVQLRDLLFVPQNDHAVAAAQHLVNFRGNKDNRHALLRKLDHQLLDPK